jgi:hypothetical protein
MPHSPSGSPDRLKKREGRRGFSHHPPQILPQALCLPGPGCRRWLVVSAACGIIKLWDKKKKRYPADGHALPPLTTPSTSPHTQAQTV